MDKKLIKRKSNRTSRWTAILMVIWIIIALTSVVGLLYYYSAYVEKRDELIKVQERLEAIEASSDVKIYTKEEAEQLAERMIEEAREEGRDEASSNYRDRIISYLDEGEGLLSMLQNFFPDKIIVPDTGNYKFIAIRDDIKKNNYRDEAFIYPTKDSTEQIISYDDGAIKGHKGIDVSRFQGDIDWNEVAADGIEFAYIRAGVRGYESGKLVLDELLEQNLEGATEAGIEVGIYFFTGAKNKEEAIEEAEFVLDNIGDVKISLPIVIDVEEVTSSRSRMAGLTMQDRTDNCIAFLERIDKAGYDTMIYGNLKTFMLLLDIERIEEYDKWFAYYRHPITYPYDYKVWQYSATGSVHGIKGDVDVNIGFY